MRDQPDNGELTTIIVEAIASVTGRDQMDLEPLYEAVDPDALRKLVRSLEDGHVTFTVEDVEVTVTSNGKVETDPDASEG